MTFTKIYGTYWEEYWSKTFQTGKIVPWTTLVSKRFPFTWVAIVVRDVQRHVTARFVGLSFYFILHTCAVQFCSILAATGWFRLESGHQNVLKQHGSNVCSNMHSPDAGKKSLCFQSAFIKTWKNRLTTRFRLCWSWPFGPSIFQTGARMCDRHQDNASSFHSECWTLQRNIGHHVGWTWENKRSTLFCREKVMGKHFVMCSLWVEGRPQSFRWKCVCICKKWASRLNGCVTWLSLEWYSCTTGYWYCVVIFVVEYVANIWQCGVIVCFSETPLFAWWWQQQAGTRRDSDVCVISWEI